MIWINEYESPCGTLMLGESRGSLCLCEWTANSGCERKLAKIAGALDTRVKFRKTKTLVEASRLLDNYFAGDMSALSAMPLLVVSTEFRRRVWEALMQIRVGHVESYGAIARSIGRGDAVRAVAGAIAGNPMSLFIPCHRVIGSDGELTGYAGGLAAKSFLLQLEGVYLKLF